MKDQPPDLPKHDPTKPPPLPHHEEREREIDAWEEGGQRYRLVERGGIYSVQAWDLYRFCTVDHNRLQILARRVAELRRGEATAADVLPMKERRKTG